MYGFIQQKLDKLEDLSIGARNQPVTISSKRSSRLPSTKTQEVADIFDITLNIGDALKTWHIIFDTDNPSFCPDFIFNDKNEDTENFFPDISSLESFQNWNITSENALVDVITDLYNAYCNHQRSRLSDYPQLNKQMKQVVSSTQYGSLCEVDIKKNGPGTYNDTIKIIIPIKVDYSNLPPYMKMKNPGEHGCRLSILYESPNLSKITPTLELSPGIQNAFSHVANLRIPAIGKSSLSVYIDRVHDLVENTVKEICEAYRRREAFMFLLISELEQSILEYDAMNFHDASFLLEINGFYFIFYIILSSKFPSERPTLFLHAVYSMVHSSDIIRTNLQTFSYDSQWEDKLMIYHIKKTIFDNIEEFQEKSLLLK